MRIGAARLVTTRPLWPEAVAATDRQSRTLGTLPVRCSTATEVHCSAVRLVPAALDAGSGNFHRLNDARMLLQTAYERKPIGRMATEAGSR